MPEVIQIEWELPDWRALDYRMWSIKHVPGFLRHRVYQRRSAVAERPRDCRPYMSIVGVGTFTQGHRQWHHSIDHNTTYILLVNL